MDNKRIYTALLILVLIMGIALRIYSWLHLNSLTFDEAVHSNPGLMMVKIISNGFDINHFKNFLSNYPMAFAAGVFYPYGYPILSAISFFIFGFGELQSRLPSMILSILIILAVYYLAKIIFKEEKAALLSAFFAAINPWFIIWGGRALADLPMAFFMVLSFYFLIKATDEDKTKYWVFSAIFCGSAFLMKPPGLLMLPFLIFYAIYQKGSSVLFKKNFIAFSAIIFVFLLSYFGFGLFSKYLLPLINADTGYYGDQIYKNIFHWFSGALTMAEAGDPTWKTFAAWFYYPKLLIVQLGGLIALCLSLIGAGTILFKKNAKKTVLIFLFIPFLYLVFSFLNNKDTRYTIPYLPFFCMLAGYGASKTASSFKGSFHFLGITIIIAITLLGSFNTLPVFNIWHTPNSGLEKAVQDIMQKNPGPIAIDENSDNMVNVNTLAFYMLMKDTGLKYSVCWPEKSYEAKYIVLVKNERVFGIK
jgi:4-amino-4-deoxy-L-arabinose transferase-like glycosyltransferase